MIRLAFDMDGVIANTYQAQIDWLIEHYPDKAQYADGRKFSDFLSDKEHEHFWGTLEEGSFFEHIKPMEGAITSLKGLNETHEVIIVTAGTILPRSCYYKYIWLEKHFPFLDMANVVFCKNKGLVKADYLIDDHDFNFVTFEGVGLLYGDGAGVGPSDYPHRIKDFDEINAYKFEKQV